MLVALQLYVTLQQNVYIVLSAHRAIINVYDQQYQHVVGGC